MKHELSEIIQNLSSREFRRSKVSYEPKSAVRDMQRLLGSLDCKPFEYGKNIMEICYCSDAWQMIEFLLQEEPWILLIRYIGRCFDS